MGGAQCRGTAKRAEREGSGGKTGEEVEVATVECDRGGGGGRGMRKVSGSQGEDKIVRSAKHWDVQVQVRVRIQVQMQLQLQFTSFSHSRSQLALTIAPALAVVAVAHPQSHAKARAQPFHLIRAT